MFLFSKSELRSDKEMNTIEIKNWYLFDSRILILPLKMVEELCSNKKDQMKKSLRWIPRHPETMKGVETDETLRGVGNKL
jgi:hypothetical protein